MSHDPSDLSHDLAVLPHLRGFPDEFERFSTLLKQAHPHGKSAAGLIIQRPGTRRFLRFVCEAVVRGEEILTTHEAAAALGIPVKEMWRRVEAGELPAPLFREGEKAVWRREDLIAACR